MEGSGHIDATVLRDADDPEVFASAADGGLESRKYYLQRWCADVAAVIDSKADPIEYVRYSAYGVPYVYAAGDMNHDGVCDSADEDAWNDLWNSGTGTARVSLDVNRDGAVSDSDDLPLVQTQIAAGSWASSGRGVLSRVGARKGYAGYDVAISQHGIKSRTYSGSTFALYYRIRRQAHFFGGKTPGS